MQCRRIAITTLVATVALVPTSVADAAELVTAAGEENLVVATRGEVTAFPVELSAEGTLRCGTHAGHPALASIETSYAIVDGTVSAGGRPSDSKPFFRARTARPPPKDGCPVSWDTSPDPYRLQASVAVSPGTAPGDYPLVLRATVVRGSSRDLSDDIPLTITVRVVVGDEPPARPLLAPPPPAQSDGGAPLSSTRGLPPPKENVSVNLLPVRGRVLVRYPGARKLVLLQGPLQMPVHCTLDTTARRVRLMSDKDGKGGLQRATFWNRRFCIAYTRAVVGGRRG